MFMSMSEYTSIYFHRLINTINKNKYEHRKSMNSLANETCLVFHSLPKRQVLSLYINFDYKK